MVRQRPSGLTRNRDRGRNHHHHQRNRNHKHNSHRHPDRNPHPRPGPYPGFHPLPRPDLEAIDAGEWEDALGTGKPRDGARWLVYDWDGLNTLSSFCVPQNVRVAREKAWRENQVRGARQGYEPRRHPAFGPLLILSHISFIKSRLLHLALASELGPPLHHRAPSGCPPRRCVLIGPRRLDSSSRESCERRWKLWRSVTKPVTPTAGRYLYHHSGYNKNHEHSEHNSRRIFFVVTCQLPAASCQPQPSSANVAHISNVANVTA